MATNHNSSYFNPFHDWPLKIARINLTKGAPFLPNIDHSWSLYHIFTSVNNSTASHIKLCCP